MLAMTGTPIRTLVCSREGLEAPDLAVTGPVMEAVCDSASNRNPAGFCYPFDRRQKITARGQKPDPRRSAPSSEAWIQAYIARQNPCVGGLSLQRRPPVAPRRHLLVGVREAQHRRVVEALADDLERQR
jgi:hypothetical protein